MTAPLTKVVSIKTGNAYPSVYANRLAAALRRNGCEQRLICLTDNAEGLDPELVEARNFPAPSFSYWDKLWLFSWEHGIEDRLLYLDLDMVVTGDVRPFVDFDGLENTGAPEGLMATGSRFRPSRAKQINSTLMSIPFGFGQKIWRRFTRFRPWVTWRYGGDSRFVESVIGADTVRWQTLFPGCLLSYKRDVRNADALPEGAVFVSFHGKPDPDEVDDPIIREHWR